MSTYREIKKVIIGDKHKPTGNTKHRYQDGDVPPAYALKIIQIGEEKGFYLIHFDASGKELTDTLHDTIDDALSQAEWEYGVTPQEWETASP